MDELDILGHPDHFMAEMRVVAEDFGLTLSEYMLYMLWTRADSIEEALENILENTEYL